jgi:hypothetical protein
VVQTITGQVPSIPVNAAVSIFVGAYLVLVFYQGNLGKLAKQLEVDFFGVSPGNTGAATASGNTVTVGGTRGQPAFWRWALALLILLALAQSKKLNFLFGPILALTLTAMLIEIASSQPGAFRSLQTGLKSLFAVGQTGVPNNG